MNEKFLIVQFEGFNKTVRCFAFCIILIREELFTISKVYNISLSNDYQICSEIKINYFNESKITEVDIEYQKSYFDAKGKGHTFLCSRDNSNHNMDFYKVPRFSESDFESIIIEIGGVKIQETELQTPDFLIKNIVLELKDIQNESLYNSERQESIAEIFKDFSDNVININPLINYGTATAKYHRLIANTIKNHVKKAGKQIKAYKAINKIDGAGLIIINTGMYSLPHELFKTIIQDILDRETKTVEFALVFSQHIQTNGWDLYANFFNEWVGIVPERIIGIKDRVGELVNKKMTEMVKSNNSLKIIESQYPISFEKNNKIFYWNPGQVSFPWEKK